MQPKKIPSFEGQCQHGVLVVQVIGGPQLDSNQQPADYESVALPLSYVAEIGGGGRLIAESVNPYGNTYCVELGLSYTAPYLTDFTTTVDCTECRV